MMAMNDREGAQVEHREGVAVEVDPSSNRGDEEVVLEEERPPAPASTEDLLQGSTAGDGQDEAGSDSLLESNEADAYRSRWEAIQATFVDEPRASVQQADGLVAEVIRRLTESFAQERSQLESRWERGDDVSTEDLRVALQRYRAFFRRLLAA